MAIGIYNLAGDLNPTFTFGGTTPLIGGTPSDAQRLDVHNNRGGTGADTFKDIKVQALAMVTVSPGVERAQASGHDAVDERWIEIRRVAGINRTMTVTDWTPIGASAWLEVPDLGNDEGAQHEIRVNPPPNADVADVSIVFRVFSSRAEAIGLGHSATHGDGVLSRSGDTTVSEIIVCSGDVLENPGGANNQVKIPDLVWDRVGSRHSLLTHLATIDGNDGNSVALASGEEYWCTLSLGAGVIAQTKSAKGVALPVTSRVAPPAGNVLLAYVLRGFDAVINTAEITNAWIVSRFGFSSVGLTANIGPGMALVDNRLVSRTGDEGEPISLSASSTNYLWLVPTGGLQKTTSSSPPTPQSYLLYVATTNGSTVTAVEDKRGFLGRRRRDVTLTIDSFYKATPGLAVNDVGPAVYFESSRDGVLCFPRAITMALDGSGSGSGSTVVDVERSEAGGSWTTLFTSSGTDDRRPTVTSGAAVPVDADTHPEVLTIKAGWRLRARVAAVPGTTVPKQATVNLQVEIP